MDWSTEFGMGMYGTLQRLVGSLARLVGKEDSRTSRSLERKAKRQGPRALFVDG